MKKVLVLLSAYNGEDYIEQQINSIFEQKDVDVYCLVRDDGSTDATVEILKALKNRYAKLYYIECNNAGWQKSFSALVFMADSYPADYYAFADQDDVWLPEKLVKGCQQLDTIADDIPGLYYSDATVVDEKLNVIEVKKNLEPPEAKESAQFICYGQGCTMMFNRKAKELFCSYAPEKPLSHECWMAMLCIYFGKVIHISESYILYRQHESNTLGSKKAGKWELIKHYWSTRGSYITYYKDLYNGYKDYLSEEDKKVIVDLLDYKQSLPAKIRLLFNKNLKRYSRSGTLMLKTSILFSRV